MTDQKGGELVSLAPQQQGSSSNIDRPTEEGIQAHLALIQERLGIGDVNVTNPNLLTRPSSHLATQDASFGPSKQE